MYPDSEHPDLVRLAARAYRLRVEDALGLAGRDESIALKRLAKTLIKAAMTADNLRSDDFATSQATWKPIHENLLLRRQLTNEYALGLGWDGAPVVVMGTEAADDLANSWTDLAFQCLLPALILAKSAPQLTRSLYGSYPPEMRERSSSRPYHVEPWDWGANAAINGNNTWAIVAQAVSATAWRTLLDGPRDLPGLGARAFQIERSAASALRARGGLAPTAERLAFLAGEVMPVLRQSATVLLMHGYGSPWRLWKERSELIAGAFLATKVDFPFPAGKATEFVDHAGRRVIWCSALNRGNRKATDDYVREVRDLVIEAAPE